MPKTIEKQNTIQDKIETNSNGSLSSNLLPMMIDYSNPEIRSMFDK